MKKFPHWLTPEKHTKFYFFLMYLIIYLSSFFFFFSIRWKIEYFFQFFGMFIGFQLNWLCIISLFFESFSRQRQLMVFHWNLSDSNSPQPLLVFWLYNSVVKMVSTCSLISKSDSPFKKP